METAIQTESGTSNWPIARALMPFLDLSAQAAPLLAGVSRDPRANNFRMGKAKATGMNMRLHGMLSRGTTDTVSVHLRRRPRHLLWEFYAVCIRCLPSAQDKVSGRDPILLLPRAAKRV